MATIYTGLESAWYLPGIYVNVDLGRGTPSAAALSRRVLLVGNRLDPTNSELNGFWEPCTESESSKTADFENDYKVDYDAETDPLGTSDSNYYRIPSLRRAAQRFGYGSELYIMAKAAFKANRNVDLWAFVQPEVSGSPAESDPVWISTSDSDDFDAVQDTENGTIKIEVLGRSCYVPVKKGQNAWDVAENIANAFNNQFRNLPYYCELLVDTSSSSYDIDAGEFGQSLTFKAKHPGLIFNDAVVEFDVGTTGVTAPSSVTIDGASGGYPNLTIETDDDKGAFIETSPLRTERFHYIVIPYNHDESPDNAPSALATFLNEQADPMVGLRQQGIFGSNDEDHDKQDCKNPRVQMVWAPGSNYFPGELAAAVASVRQKWEGSDPAVNLCLKPVAGVPMAEDVNLQTPNVKNDAIAAGVTPVVPHEGNMVILRSVTTAADHSTFPVFDTGKVTVSDFVADDIEIKMLARYKGFKLSPDTDMPLPSKVTTPSRIRMALLEWLRSAEAKGIITRVTEMAEQVQVEIDEDVPGRVNFEIPEDVVDIFAVGAGNIIQIG